MHVPRNASSENQSTEYFRFVNSALQRIFLRKQRKKNRFQHPCNDEFSHIQDLNSACNNIFTLVVILLHLHTFAVVVADAAVLRTS
jgi:hypothetical protein